MSSDESRSSRRRPRPLPPVDLPPGPLKDLKDLLHRLYQAAQAPTMEAIASTVARLADALEEEFGRSPEDIDALIGAAPKKDAINRILSRPELPPSEQDTVAVAVALARLGDQPGRDLTTLVDRVRGAWRRAHAAPPPHRLGRPIADCDPLALEVHRAIDGGEPGEALPRYVPRGHDAELADIVADVVGGSSRVVTLVGGSSTGKTRAAWEAVRALPSPWRLWHPIDPGRSPALAHDLGAIGPHTVVWLNELQHYLMPADPALAEPIAAGLRTLLGDATRGPVLVIGTVWAEHWTSITAVPPPGPVDPYAQARALLTGSEIAVPDTFQAAELASLQTLTGTDSRLAQAVEHAEQGQITQYLAGAPVLLQRYRTAPAAARALIEVAMDARRLGHGPELPLSFLAAAAPGYLTESQWDLLREDWLEQALAYTAAPCLGARGPLTRIRPRPGDALVSGEPGYRLADYLEQHGRAGRRDRMTPTAFWTACVTHAKPADAGQMFALRYADDTSRTDERDQAIALLSTALAEPLPRHDELLTHMMLSFALLGRLFPILERQDMDPAEMEEQGLATLAAIEGDTFRLAEMDRVTEHLAAALGSDVFNSPTHALLQRMKNAVTALRRSLAVVARRSGAKGVEGEQGDVQ